MQIGQRLIPRRIDMDSSPLNIPSDAAFFMKGIEVDWINDASGQQNAGEMKPMESNVLYCSIVLPDGLNTVVGSFFYEEATECYIVVHNSNNNHLIYRLEGKTGNCTIVYRFCPSTAVIPTLSILTGGNPFIAGTNTGTLTGTPGTIVVLQLTGNGSIYTTGYIGTTLISAVGSTTTITIPANGSIDYDIFSAGNGNGLVILSHSFNSTFGGITTDPKDFFNEGRIAIKSLCKFLPDGTKELYKELFLVNKKIPNTRIVIEDSIATNSFTTPFFTPKNSCCGDICRIIKVGVPTPMADIKVVPIPATAEDAKRQNTMLFKMFKFRLKHINAWGQPSEHGKISDAYFNNLAACSKDPAGSPHCVWLETKTPCPEIVKIIVEVQTCDIKGDSGVTDGALISDWKEAFTIDLYDQQNADLKWYERSYKVNNNEFEFLNNGKDLRIKFCNNRECKTIAAADVRDQNPAPITSGTVAAIGKGLIYGDNENEYDKVSEEDKAGVSFSVVPSDACATRYSHIKVYAVVHNFYDAKNNPVWLNGTKTGFGGFGQDPVSSPSPDFEALVMDAEPDFGSNGGYGQFFPDGVKGFRGVLAGTGIQAESTQKVWIPGNPALGNLGVLTGDLDYIKQIVWGSRPSTYLFLQEFDLGLVPLGHYSFRILGHSDTENIQNTSTFYLCNTTWNGYSSSFVVNGDQISKEIFINTTGGADYSSLTADEVAVIADLTFPSKASSDIGTKSVRGYLYEEKNIKQPIDLAFVIPQGSLLPALVSSLATDHNGFYFFSCDGNAFVNYHIDLKGYNRCVSNQTLGVTPQKTGEGTSKAPDLFAVDRYPNYVTDACNRYVVQGTIKECGNAGGIEGVAVILSRAKPVYTDTQGQFRATAHFNPASPPHKLIVSAAGNCNVLDCNCSPVNIILNVGQPGCTDCILNVVNVGNFNLQTVVRKGFEHGSRVPIGMEAHDWLGRHTDIQDMENWIVDIPTEQEQGNSSYQRIKVTLPASFSSRFCKYFKHLTFFFGKDPDFEDFFEWAADKVEFIDSAGNVNINNPSKVKIWYRGLNEYNSLRGFKTNTNWGFVDSAGDSRAGDIVEFIQNADGVYLPVRMVGNIQYNKGGAYFTVDFDQSLRALKDGVRFKLKRPVQCLTNKPYYEYSFTINFCSGDCIPRDDNGNIVTEFYLEGFTSYMLPRQIPVVTDVITQVPITGGGTEDVTTTKIEVKTYPFNFEHHSPSDTWGDHCFNGGRIGFKNPYEGKKCNRNQLLLTGALNSATDGVINYLHYFSLADELLIDEQGWGGIQAIIVRDDGQIMLICENTTFSLAYNDDRAVVTQDGYVKLPTNGRFSRPEKDAGFAYGCQSQDLNTIRRNGAFVMYLDAQKVAVVLHNFATAVDIADGIKSWLVQVINKPEQVRDRAFFHAHFDNHNSMKYILTHFNPVRNEWLNHELDTNIKFNETVAYNLTNKYWEQGLHFTPEYYANMYGEKRDTQFFSFKNGLPYSHHNALIPTATYLNYYGVQCIPVIGVVTNTEATKVKTYLWNEVYCFEQLFVLERLLTEMGQKSQVLEGAWEWGEGFWMAPYQGDTQYPDNSDTSSDAIMDGDSLYGRWLKATYIPKPVYNGEFFKITAIISFFAAREKSSGGS